MNRLSLTAFLSLAASSCSVSTPVPGTHYAMEDLVLIEFAARLEEDYHRLHPGQIPGQPSSSASKTGTFTPPVDVGAGEPHEPVEEQVAEPVEYDPGK
jgi:hypothetical protein